MSEDKVVIVFAKAWNRLVSNGFLDLPAPSDCYALQWVLDELVGVPAIAKYLTEKM